MESVKEDQNVTNNLTTNAPKIYNAAVVLERFCNRGGTRNANLVVAESVYGTTVGRSCKCEKAGNGRNR